MTRQHWGLIVVVIGTALLAFSVKVRRQYEGEMGVAIDKLKRENPKLIEPTETIIVQKLFWSGLVLIAAGTLLQW